MKPVKRQHGLPFIHRIAWVAGLWTAMFVEAPAAHACQADEKSNQVVAWTIDLEEISRLSKSATTAPEFARLIDLCDQTLNSETMEQDRAYVQSMKSWALNRRGELRLDLFDQLAGIQNQTQSQLVLEQAASDFEESKALDPKRWRAWLGLGIVNFHVGNLAQAQACFRRVHELQPQRAVGFFNAAEIEYSLGEYVEALENYKKAVELDVGDLQAMVGAAHCLRRLGRTEEAREAYQGMVNAAQENPSVHEQLGEFLTSSGDWKDAIESFEKAIKLGSKTANLRLCEMLLNCPDDEFRDVERGMGLFRKIRESDTDLLAQIRIPNERLISLGIEQDSTDTVGQQGPDGVTSSGVQPLAPIRKE